MEHKLLNNSLLLIQSADNDLSLEQILLQDEKTFADVAGIAKNSKSAITSLVKVLQAEKMKEIVLTAHPMEVIPLRHEVKVLDELLDRLDKYAVMYDRQSKQQQNKTEEPQSTP